MPRAAWVEIRDDGGELIVTIPAEINGGSISAELPAFPPGTFGAIQLCTEDDGAVWREPPELEELPTGPQLMIIEMG